MLVYTHRPKDQKELFFKLKTTLGIDSDMPEKLEGLYAIFKDNVCLYVGQSRNIPSRLATHLSGKYTNADEIKIYTDNDDHGSLDESEKWLIQYYKPMENKLIDYSEKLDANKLFSQFHDYTKGATYSVEDEWSFKIMAYKYEMAIISDDFIPCFYGNKTLTNYLSGEIGMIEKARERAE